MTILLYQPGWTGFLSGVFECFARKREELSLRPLRAQQEAGLFASVVVPPDEARADRVERGLKRLGSTLPELVYKAFLSEREGMEDHIVAVLRRGFADKKSPLGDLRDPDVAAVRKAAQFVGGEAHRMLQFVRFVRTPEGIFCADIAPDTNVLTLIAEHFHGRFGDQRLLIRDTGRLVALVSQPEGWHLAALEPPLPPLPQDGEFEALWQRYFKIIANPARLNLKLQRQLVPHKYRTYLTEFR